MHRQAPAGIRPFEPRDVEPLLDTWYAASRLAHAFLDEAFFEEERRDIPHLYLPHAETWVYEHEGAVVGFIALLGNEVGALFVHPDHHGRGIGRALMDHARALREVLELDVFQENRLGRGFYARYGFVQVGQRLHAQTGRTHLRLRLEARTGAAGPPARPA